MMKVDYYFAPGPPQGATAAALEARDLGYDGFFTAETQHDPFLPLAFAGAAAPEMDLGTAIAVAFPRSPMVTAMTAWDLAPLTRGQLLLGLGTQVRAHITRRFSTAWERPVAQLGEYIEALRAIWDTFQNGTPLQYRGDFYQFTLMTPFFDPGPIRRPRIPIYIAGVGPHLSRLAGRSCDGFHVHPLHTVRYLDGVVLPNIESAASKASRTRADVDLATTVFVMTGPDDSAVEQAMEPVRQQIAFYASTPSYRPVLEASGWGFGEELHAMSKRGQWADMAALVPDEAVLEVGVAAGYDDLAGAIRGRYGDRVQRIGFYTIGSALSVDHDALGQVIAGLKQR